MRLPEFDMERWQSRWEHQVRFNLAESGVHPLRMHELIAPGEVEALEQTQLGYIQTDGTPELKACIASLYAGAGPENILITTGSAEANFLLLWHLLEPDDHVLFMRPNFLQMQGLTQAFGSRCTPFFLQEELGWQPDINQVADLISGETKLIVITDPNNPTGSVLDGEHRKALLDLASRTGAWLLVDEVYRGAELRTPAPSSWWGEYPKTLITCGLSKAYGLPGLRVGWMIGPPEVIQACWSCKDYTSITISALSDRLAVLALRPEKRRELLARTRRIIQGNWDHLAAWMDRLGGLLTCVPPQAGAIAYPRYHGEVPTLELARNIRERHSVLICPGEHFGLPGYLRLGLGNQPSYQEQALRLVEAGL
jgi:aspartate/methionine/tyrosine aminotransferase